LKRAWIGVGLLLGFFVLAMFLLAEAEAQTTAPAPDPHAGAFDRLSPGNQKIARALFEAQQSPTAPGAPAPLSLNDIAAMKESGRGWGVIFKDLKRQGLVTERNLGQAVSRFNHQPQFSSSGGGTQITTAGGKTWVVDAPGGSGSPGAQGRGARSEDGDHAGMSSSAGGPTSASGHGGGVSAGRGGSPGGGRGK
jgi:hypothetical protein